MDAQALRLTPERPVLEAFPPTRWRQQGLKRDPPELVAGSWHSCQMGSQWSAICKECRTKFEVSEGSGMEAMPFHCDRCGKEWWWNFGPRGPGGKASPPECPCGGAFSVNAPLRCPECQSTDLEPDPAGVETLYD